MNCQTFFCGFSSGHFAGRGRSVMLGGTVNRLDRCQPAWSSRRIACLPGADRGGDFGQMQVHCFGIAGGQNKGCALAVFRAVAPKIYAEAVRWSRGADGRVPRLAHRRVRHCHVNRRFVDQMTVAATVHAATVAWRHVSIACSRNTRRLEQPGRKAGSGLLPAATEASDGCDKADARPKCRRAPIGNSNFPPPISPRG